MTDALICGAHQGFDSNATFLLTLDDYFANRLGSVNRSHLTNDHSLLHIGLDTLSYKLQEGSHRYRPFPEHFSL